MVVSQSVRSQSLSTAYESGDDLAARLDRDGFVELRGILDPDVASHFGGVISDEIAAERESSASLDDPTTFQKAFVQVTNVWRRNDVVAELVFSSRLARVAAQLLGVPSVRLYHDQALYKESGGGVTPWHADSYYWPLASDRVGTIWIPLQDTPEEMGALQFAVGSHQENLGRDLPISDESERDIQSKLDDMGFEVASPEYRLGDATFHLGWTFHRAGANSSGRARKAMTIIYMDANMRIAPPLNQDQQRDLEAWFPDSRVAGIADGPLTPVIEY